MPASIFRCVALHFCSCALLVATLLAQPPSTVPPNGLRDNTPACHARSVRIVVSPGKTIEKGTIVVRDGKIVAVGARMPSKRPPTARSGTCPARRSTPD